MQLSHRISHLTEDETGGWEIFIRAREMIAQGIAVTELTIGEHDVKTDPAIVDAMHAAARGGHTGYSSVPGVPALRRAVAERVQARTGVPTTPANVLITAGGQAALFAAHHAVCEAGDVAVFIDPYYATYPGTIRGAGAVPRAVQTRSRDAFQPREDALASAAKGARSLLVNSPNNPTGVVYDRATHEAIARVCIANDLWLISDEVYDTQVWEGDHISPRTLPGMAERTLVVGSMSKSHAMTGSRVGWIVGPEPAISALANLATHTTYGVPGYIQDAALFALNRGPELEKTIAAPFRRRRDLARSVLAGQNSVVAVPAQGAMYLMLDIRATGLSGADFAARLLEERRVAVMPGESFGASAAGHLRVAMTVGDDAFRTALVTLCDFASGLAEARR